MAPNEQAGLEAPLAPRQWGEDLEFGPKSQGQLSCALLLLQHGQEGLTS